IVTAARLLFSRNGFDQTTVRDIAAEAGIDPALIVRYFGGKEALFIQAADIALELPDVSSIDRSDIGLSLARHFLKMWEDGGSHGGLPVLLRSAASNEGAAERLREIFARQVVPVLRLILPEDRALERAAMISTQLLGVALCRYILKLPPLVAIPADRLAVLVGAAIQNLIVDTPRD
ncbi:TetR family transcriptional regulator, partial [Cypionkella sp.]|uniref:TetR/AcrR family transcriptional regulator n=1 Tax=Cypionkella sp. TaxID=2811411 RepID=UPI002ABCA219